MKTTKGQITLVTIPENISYILLPSVTQISIATDGTISAPIVTCRALKQEGSRMPVELGSLEGTIYYKSNLHDQYYEYVATGHDAGVAISDLWSCLTFTLVLAGESDYITRVDVPITRSGQVDTNFRVWVGTVADPNTLLLYPWYGELSESQDPFMHINDYYVSPDMTYYCFIYDGTQQQHIWDEVTDINLKRWLARANNSTTGFIVTYHQGTPINTDVADFFLSREYIIGDLWSNAKYTTTSGGQTVMLYDDEPLICKQSKTNGFNINDWLPISAIKDKLRETGIDVDEHKVTITADETWAVNNNGQRVAIINNVDGHPKITSSLLHINGDVLIEGGAIIEALGNLEDDGLEELLEDKGIVPTSVSHDASTGKITVVSDGNTYHWYTDDKADDKYITFGTHSDQQNADHSFTLRKDGTLIADNAVIYGEVHATKGSFEGTLQSAGGAFSVDLEGNVKATSFNGTGVLMSGTTIITEDNFYDYFSQSLLDINNGSTLDNGYNAPFNKRWIPNLKKIQNNIYFESLPQEVLFYPDGGNIPYALIVMPHYFYEHDTARTGSGVLRKSCRRGDLTYQEMCQLDGRTYTFLQKLDPDMNVIILTTLFTDNDDCGDYFILTSNVRTGASEQDFAQIKYLICHNTNGTSYYGGVYSKLQTRVDQGFLSLWSDIDEDGNVTVTNNQQPDVPINGDSEYNINMYLVSRSGNTFCFRWECSSIVNIEGIGTLSLPGYYVTVTQENGQNVYHYVMGVVQGPVVYGLLVSGAVQYGTDGQYQSGYLCITANKEIDQSFKFANISLQHTSGNVIYNIKV